MKKRLIIFIAIILLFSMMTACNATNPPVEEEQEVIYRIDSNKGNSIIHQFIDLQEEQMKFAVPFTIKDNKLEILQIMGVQGYFAEKGSYIETENVLTIKVRNNRDVYLQAAQIILKDQNGENYYFKMSYIPAGAEMIVQESKNYQLTGDEIFSFVSCDINEKDNPYQSWLNSNSAIDIQPAGQSNAVITNLSNRKISNMQIYYKTCKDNCYQGGITYRMDITNPIPPKSSVHIITGHFQKESEIVEVKIQYE